MLLDEADLYGTKKVPVQAGVYDQDNNFGNLVPDVIDIDKSITSVSLWTCREHGRLLTADLQGDLYALGSKYRRLQYLQQ